MGVGNYGNGVVLGYHGTTRITKEQEDHGGQGGKRNKKVAGSRRKKEQEGRRGRGGTRWDEGKRDEAGRSSAKLRYSFGELWGAPEDTARKVTQLGGARWSSVELSRAGKKRRKKFRQGAEEGATGR